MSKHLTYLTILVGVISLFSCDPQRVYEKDIDMINYQWLETEPVSFSMDMEDTEAKNLYINLRHRFNFNWRNIWMNMYITFPNDSTHRYPINLQLSQPDGQWFGDCSGDICNIQVPISEFTNYSFKDTGNYTFQLEQIMRENPLESIMSIGLRVENLEQEE